jgi:iron(III) transport system permease protein
LKKNPIHPLLAAGSWVSRLQPALFLLVVFIPLVILAADLAAQIAGGGVSWLHWAGSAGRRGMLLWNSVQLSAAVAAAAISAGVLAASMLWSWHEKPFLYLRWLVILFAAVPPYIHALAWSTVFASARTTLGPLGLDLPPLGGWGGSWWVQVMAFLPLAVGLALLGLETVDPYLIEAGRTLRSDTEVLTRIALPLAAPALLAGGGFVFIFSLMDYSIPSLFGKTVYALEIFAEHSAAGKPASAFLVALPLLLLGAAVVYFSQSPLREAAQRPPWGLRPWRRRARWPAWLRALQLLAAALLFLQILVPLAGLSAATGGWENLAESVRLARREILFSLGVALAAALLVLPLAYPAAAMLIRPGRSRRRWWFWVTVPLAVPAPLVGIGLIAAWNRPFWGGIYGSAAMPVLAALARFAPLAALLLLAQLRRSDPLLLDAARVLQRRPIDTWLKVRLPMLAPGLLAAASLCFALTLGELGATLIVAPPGMATLTMRLYNLLHYGATDMVAGLCLVMAAVTAAAGALVFGLLVLWNRYTAGERRSR